MPDQLVAVYADPDQALRAVQALRAQGVANAQVSSPAAYPVVHEVKATAHTRALGWVALLGGLIGLGCATALEAGTSQALGLVVGGKPILAWTAFAVVMFELTMLFAGAANFVALIVFCALARHKVARAIRDQVSSERIVVVVPIGGLEPHARDAVRSVLGDAVAEALS
ncbi:MAG: quinol:electron acceptor oxidoreductase subunit ActD [Myxococcaceae bacterium]